MDDRSRVPRGDRVLSAPRGGRRVQCRSTRAALIPSNPQCLSLCTWLPIQPDGRQIRQTRKIIGSTPRLPGSGTDTRAPYAVIRSVRVHQVILTPLEQIAAITAPSAGYDRDGSRRSLARLSAISDGNVDTEEGVDRYGWPPHAQSRAQIQPQARRTIRQHKLADLGVGLEALDAAHADATVDPGSYRFISCSDVSVTLHSWLAA